MKNTNNISQEQENDMLPEYDFKDKKGVRGKYFQAMQKGYTVRIKNEDGTVTVQQFYPTENTVILDPDVRYYFPDSESVNRTLRSLIELIPERSKTQASEKKAKYNK